MAGPLKAFYIISGPAQLRLTKLKGPAHLRPATIGGPAHLKLERHNGPTHLSPIAFVEPTIKDHVMLADWPISGLLLLVGRPTSYSWYKGVGPFMGQLSFIAFRKLAR
jgi:hypothetical protein